MFAAQAFVQFAHAQENSKPHPIRLPVVQRHWERSLPVSFNRDSENAERFPSSQIAAHLPDDRTSVVKADSSIVDFYAGQAFAEGNRFPPVHSLQSIESIPTLTHEAIGISADSVPRWRLSLEESIQVGLANNKDIAVITPSSSIAATLVSIERGDFDPVVGVSVFGGQDDRQVRSNIANFNSGLGFQNRDFFRPLSGLNQAFVRQRLASGGSYEIGYGTNYQRFDPVGTDLLLASGWESSLNFQLSQPLLRGRGVASSQQRIRVAAARQRQSEYEFRARLREIVRSIDIAYWELAGAQKRVEAAERFVLIAEKAAEDEAARKELGQSAKPDVLQTQRLVLEFKITLEQSRRARDVAELRLRRELGIAQLAMKAPLAMQAPLTLEASPASEGYDSRYDLPIEVVSVATETVSSADLDSAIAQAMSRPELSATQARIDQAKIALAAARNNLLPDVTAHAVFSKTGLQKNLDDSVSTLFDDDFGTWGAGVTYQRRLKQRSEHAAVRKQCLLISQYQAEQNRIAHDIVAKLRTLVASIESYQRTLSQQESLVEVLAEQQEGFDELYTDNRVTLFQRLENARASQLANHEKIDTWVLTMTALADWRFERGDDASSFGIDVTTHAAW